MNQFVKKLLREPLFHFLIIGAGLFLIFGWKSGSVSQPDGQSVPQSTEIIVTQGQIEHLTAQFKRIWQRPPAEQELQGLINSHVRDEISYREATAMGLDRNDATIRRRLRLKLEALNEDIAAAMSPTDQDLQEYLEQHPDSFFQEPRAAFRQVFLNPESRSTNIDGDARTLLARLRLEEPDADLSGFGDTLVMLSNDLPLSPLSEIGRLFGEQFGRSIVALETGTWQGPVKSGYGLHLVLVNEWQPGRLPELADVRDKVEREWVFARKMEAQDAMYKKLGERYAVVIEAPAAPDKNVPGVFKTESEKAVR